MYEKLLDEAYDQKVEVYEKPLKPNTKGLYSDNIIWINKYTPTNIEKLCILAEELGHHYTSAGDILDQSKVMNRKQEKRARNWAYKKLIPLEKLVLASDEGIYNKFELARYLGVTEVFLEEALKRYKEEYGLFVNVNKKILYFDPLGVLEFKIF